MKFTKMEGLGNDYVYVNCFAEKVENPSEVAKKVSDRHFGIGSDGLILINPSKVADCEMEMYNSDGSRSEMCGNGIRCVGKYVYDHGIVKKDSISVETLAGIKYIDFIIEDDKVKMATVNMGAPVLDAENVPYVPYSDEYKEKAVSMPITADGVEFKTTCVSMGNPHSVVFVDKLDEFDFERFGPIFECHETFPRKVNAEFVEIIDRTHVRMRVYERGAGETLACGTGATAVAMACILNGYTEDEVRVTLLGGDLIIRYDREKNLLFMTGPATTVFDGEIEV